MGLVGRFGNDLEGFCRVSAEIFNIPYQFYRIFDDLFVLLQPVLQNCRMWWDIVGYSRIWKDMEGYARICWDMLGYVRDLLGHVGICRICLDMQGYGGKCWDMLGYSRIR